jgi:hypothetical protein
MILREDLRAEIEFPSDENQGKGGRAASVSLRAVDCSADNVYRTQGAGSKPTARQEQ